MCKSDELEDLRYLVDYAADRTVHYTVGFVKETGEGPSQRADLGGSGTLVRYKDIHGILTADHVITNLDEEGDVGLVMKSGMQVHRYILRKRTHVKLRIAPRVAGSIGPDIGFIRLGAADVDSVGAVKSFHNLETSRSKVLDENVLPEKYFWGISGLIEEWTSTEVEDRTSRRIKVFESMCGVGTVSDAYFDDGYDYRDFNASFGEGYEGPVNYQGISGGGLWRFDVKSSLGDKDQIVGATLRGVAFYQSAIENETRAIVCHAEHSVYEHLINEIVKYAS